MLNVAFGVTWSLLGGWVVKSPAWFRNRRTQFAILGMLIAVFVELAMAVVHIRSLVRLRTLIPGTPQTMGQRGMYWDQQTQSAWDWFLLNSRTCDWGQSHLVERGSIEVQFDGNKRVLAHRQSGLAFSEPPDWSRLQRLMEERSATQFVRVESARTGWPWRSFSYAIAYIPDNARVIGNQVLRGADHESHVGSLVALVTLGSSRSLPAAPSAVFFSGFVGNVMLWWLVIVVSWYTPQTIRNAVLRRRRRQLRCERCGYPLQVTARGLARCPECGTIPTKLDE